MDNTPSPPPPPAPPPGGSSGGSGGGGPAAGSSTPAAGSQPNSSNERVAAWRIQRATKEIDQDVKQVWADHEAKLTNKHGPVDGKLDTTLQRRSSRLEQLQIITKPSDEERTLAKAKSDHALLEQMHQAGRATDKLPPPLVLATKQVKDDHAAAQRAEARAHSRVRKLNDAYHQAKAQGATDRQLARIDQQRAKERQLLAAAREQQKDLRAEQEAIHQRTRQLQQANDAHGRVLSRAVAAALTLQQRGRDLTRWAGIIAHPTRAEEHAVMLGGRETQRELAAENHKDRSRREQAIRDRAEMGQLIAASQPQPAQEKQKDKEREKKDRDRDKEKEKQQEQTRTHNRTRNRSRDDRGRGR